MTKKDCMELAEIVRRLRTEGGGGPMMDFRMVSRPDLLEGLAKFCATRCPSFNGREWMQRVETQV